MTTGSPGPARIVRCRLAVPWSMSSRVVCPHARPRPPTRISGATAAQRRPAPARRTCAGPAVCRSAGPNVAGCGRRRRSAQLSFADLDPSADCRCATPPSSSSTWRPPAAAPSKARRRTLRRDHRDRRGQGARRRGARRIRHPGRPAARDPAADRAADRHHHRDGAATPRRSTRCCRCFWSSPAARCWWRTTPGSTSASCSGRRSSATSPGPARRCCARCGWPAGC